jgi:hypothetical protein
VNESQGDVNGIETLTDMAGWQTCGVVGKA